MGKRLNIERQNRLEPERIETAKKKLTELGILYIETNKSLKFQHKGSEVTFFPYSGYFTGKTVNDDRGLSKLLKQIQNK